MRMYVWDGQKPYRDGSLEEGIVVHEVSYGFTRTGRALTSNSSRTVFLLV